LITDAIARNGIGEEWLFREKETPRLAKNEIAQSRCFGCDIRTFERLNDQLVSQDFVTVSNVIGP